MAGFDRYLSRRKFLGLGLNGLAIPIVLNSMYRIFEQPQNVITAKSGGLKGNGTDETKVLKAFLNKIKDGNIVDFQGLEIRVLSNIKGADKSDAANITDILRIYNKRNVTIKNGIIRVMNPSVRAKRTNFPSTFSIVKCQNIKIENFSFYGKGEGWGDADASFNLTREQRVDYLQVNGGSTLLILKSKNVTIQNCKAFLCGSVGTFYVSSSDKVYINDCHANPASLGYSAYCADAWCGSNIDNQNSFYLEVNNCTAYSGRLESGSPKYCAKAGVLVEDKGVNAVVNGGSFSDMYANGRDKNLGSAFGVLSAELEVNGSKCSRCASVGYIACSSPSDTLLKIRNVVGSNIGLTALITGVESFGKTTCEFSNCTINIDGSRTWPQSGDEYKISSIVTNLRSATWCNFTFNSCTITGSDIISQNNSAVYGKLFFVNCDLSVKKYLVKSQGWGGSSKSLENLGLYMSGRVSVTDQNELPLIDWTNKSSKNVFTWVNIDMSDATITTNSKNPRKLLNYSDKAGGRLNSFIRNPVKNTSRLIIK